MSPNAFQIFKNTIKTILICALLSLPIQLLFMIAVESVFDFETQVLDFSRIDLEKLVTSAKSALFPFENPEKFPRRLLAGASVGVCFSLGFGFLGSNNRVIPLAIAALYFAAAIAAFVFTGGEEDFGQSTQLEQNLIFLTFLLSAFILWFMLKIVWKP
jgi:hypothetical protein